MKSESCASINVATEKPHVQAYIAPDIHARLMEYKQKKGCSKSEAIESLLNIYLGIDSKTIEMLEEWAKVERRPIEQQVQVIVEDAVDSWSRDKSGTG